MSPPVTHIKDWRSQGFSMIIDVRSESEFADDHIPGAVNMPVLSDDQRAEIGTMYKQVGTFEAKRSGAALVARNIADHLETKLGDAPRAFRPLIYCWRGGQRSAAMARILSEIGWRVTLLEGGYKTYRKQVLAGLAENPNRLQLIIMRGRTGSAKTHILRAAQHAGAQVIDLEGLANHRGSLLGPEPGIAQPSQRLFESRLQATLAELDPSRPVFVEAESTKIGRLHIPQAMWQKMRAAPAVEIVAPTPARVAFLLTDYAHIIAEPARLDPLLDWVASRIGGDKLADWRMKVAAGDWPGFVTAVLEDHYDPAYDRSSVQRSRNRLGAFAVNTLDLKTIDSLAQELAEMNIPTNAT